MATLQSKLDESVSKSEDLRGHVTSLQVHTYVGMVMNMDMYT